MEKRNSKLISIAEDNNISIGLVDKYYNIIKNNPKILDNNEYYLLRCLNLLIILREIENNNSIDFIASKAIDKVNSNVRILKRS